jgi:hypothetical protein
MANEIYLDDLIYSMMRYLQEAIFTVKDLTGAAELTRGTLAGLYPGLQVIALRMFDLETLPVPCVGVSCETVSDPDIAWYGEGGLYTYSVRLLVVGEVTEAGEQSYDASVVRTLQLQTGLENQFRNGIDIDWYRAVYDSLGSATAFGSLRAGPGQTFPISEVEFAMALPLELCG